MNYKWEKNANNDYYVIFGDIKLQILKIREKYFVGQYIINGHNVFSAKAKTISEAKKHLHKFVMSVNDAHGEMGMADIFDFLKKGLNYYVG